MNVIRLVIHRKEISLLLIFASLAIVQVAAFVWYMDQEVVWSPYMAVDSHWYLYFNYRIVTALGEAQSIPRDLLASPQGIFFYLQSALFQFILGAGRVGAVSPNLAYYLVFQGITMLAIWKITSSRTASVVAYSLALLVLSPLLNTYGQPNLADFYPDVVMGSMCGIFLFCVLLSDCFRIPRWAVIAGLVAGLQVALRVVTISTIFATYLVWICIILFCVTNTAVPHRKDIWRRRLRWIAISALAAGIIALAALAPAYETFITYYLGWLRGESISNLSAGHPEALATSLWDKYLYYPENAFRLSIGVPFATAVVFLWVALSWAGGKVALLTRTNRLSETVVDGSADWKLFICFALVTALVSYVLLTHFPARSPFIARLLAMPLIVIAITITAILTATVDMKAPFAPRPLQAITAVSLLMALAFQIMHYARPGPSNELRADWIGLRKMYEHMGSYLRASEVLMPKISSDVLIPYSGGYAQNFSALEFERTGKLFAIIPGFKNDGDTIIRNESVDKLRNSDLVLLDELSSKLGARYTQFMHNATLKHDKSLMETTSPPLRGFAHRNFMPISAHPMFGGSVTLLAAVRPRVITSSMTPLPDRTLLVEGGPGWRGHPSTGPAWIQFDYRFPARVAAVELALAEASPFSVNYNLQGRTADGNWISLLDTKATVATAVHKVVSPDWFQSYRIEFVSENAGGGSVSLRHIRFIYSGYGWSGNTRYGAAPIDDRAWEPAPRTRTYVSSYPPRLILSAQGYNIVDFGGLFWGVPHGVEVRWGDENLRQKSGVLLDITVDGLLARISVQSSKSILLAPRPHLLEVRKGYNLVAFKGLVYAIPHAVGEFDLEKSNVDNASRILRDSSIESLRERIDRENNNGILVAPRPRLLEVRKGYNLVAFKGLVYAIPHAVGEFDLEKSNADSASGILRDSSIESLRARIDRGY